MTGLRKLLFYSSLCVCAFAGSMTVEHAIQARPRHLPSNSVPSVQPVVGQRVSYRDTNTSRNPATFDHACWVSAVDDMIGDVNLMCSDINGKDMPPLLAIPFASSPTAGSWTYMPGESLDNQPNTWTAQQQFNAAIVANNVSGLGADIESLPGHNLGIASGVGPGAGTDTVGGTSINIGSANGAAGKASGNVNITTGLGGGGAISGSINLMTGNVGGAAGSGVVFLFTGAASGAGQRSGDIIALTGSAGAGAVGGEIAMDSQGAGIYLCATDPDGSTFGQCSEVKMVPSTGKLGFFGHASVVRPAAYTLTFPTSSRTMPAATSAAITDSTGGTPSTTFAAITAGAVYAQADAVATKNALSQTAASINALNADISAAKQVTNQIIKDMQAFGLLQ